MNKLYEIISKFTNYEMNQWVRAGKPTDLGIVKSFIGIRKRRKEQGRFK